MEHQNHFPSPNEFGIHYLPSLHLSFYPQLQWCLFYFNVIGVFSDYKWARIYRGFLFCAWRVTQHSVLQFHVAAGGGIPPFLGLNNTPLCVYATFALSRHPSVNILVASVSWLLWILLQWAWACRYLWHNDFIFFEYVSSCAIAGSYGSSVFNFEEAPLCFPWWLY